ncbi:MAG TPA: alkaline phosphatase family protein, partial [Myxococcales bacterium]|nr:alkaline phosphatase family protein [Myxococcales bacterium]
SRNANSANCIAHVRPFTELATDLANNAAPRYAFITPNACDDGHNSSGCATTDEVKNTDNWLAANVPTILNSAAYRNNGALFITWDESEGTTDVPIGMIVLSPKAKGHGYSNSISYTHSSTLRTMQEIFGVQPFLGDAANATDLSDLFSSFP